MIGNVAQVYSPYLYDKSTGPQYLPAMIANSVFVLASMAVCGVLYFCLRWENTKLEAAQVVMDGQHIDDPKQNEEIVQPRFEGTVRLDPNFRYIL